MNEDVPALKDQLFGYDILADDHLTYEVLEALVDNASNDVDREIAQVHLEVCSRCAADLRALGELRDQSPAIVLQQTEGTKRSPFTSWGWPKLAVAAATALAFAAIVWFAWRSQNRTPQTNTQVVIGASPLPTSSPISTASVSPSPEILVSLRDAGGTVTLDSRGNIAGLRDLSPTLREAIKRTLSTEQLNIGPSLAGLRSRNGTLMGSRNDGTPFRLLSPVGLVVQSDRPTFRWQPSRGATAYVVKVYDSDFKEVASSLSQTATSWTSPLALPRGAVYTWQVTALKDGQEIKSPLAPAAPVRFRVLSKDKLDDIRRVQRTTPNSHLALGTVYAEAGLLDEARRELRMLLRNNPDSKLVKTLLREVDGR